MSMPVANKQIMEKWAPVLDHPSLPSIKEQYRREVTAVLLENQEREMAKQSQALFEDAPVNSGGLGVALGSAGASTNTVAGYDPVLISLVRRAMPQLIAYDICGVQPMTQPTGLIFAMKSRYGTQGGTEALFNEADTDFSGTGTHSGSNWTSGTDTTGTAMTTATAEALGSGGANPDFNEMAFSIEKTAVVAQSRALKAGYSIELAQDLKAVHGLSAENELSNIMANEILAEINREVIRKMYFVAKPGAQVGTATAGTFDLDIDANGRWSVEKFKGMLFQIDREANAIAQQTRMGRGNFIICSSDVASALALAGVLDYAPALNTGLNVDEASTTFAGVLQGKYKVFVDPYQANQSATQFFMVGYKGQSAWDAGMYYCPYIPLEKLRAVDPKTLQPVIGYKTRYALQSHPHVQLDGNGTNLQANSNYYFRKVKVTNL